MLELVQSDDVGISRSASGVELMSDEDCVRLLSGTTTVGRVAFQSAAGQQLLPVNFVFRRGRVYFLTAPESTLAELAAGHSDVAFEIDHHERMTQHAWSVQVKGETRGVEPSDVNLSPEEPYLWAPSEPRPWAPGKRDLLVELIPESITGRRVTGGA